MGSYDWLVTKHKPILLKTVDVTFSAEKQIHALKLTYITIY